MPDTWPPPGPQKRPPTLEHVRDLWTLHWSQSTCTAALWRNDFGLELRVLHGGELIESRLSRFGEAPLLLTAEEVKTELICCRVISVGHNGGHTLSDPQTYLLITSQTDEEVRAQRRSLIQGLR